MRVLIVEDEDAIAEPLAEGLEREGYAVERAATGAQALAAGGNAEVDVVLLDLRLPDIDGYTVCRELRARSDVPIIIVSARGEEVDRVVGLELGRRRLPRQAVRLRASCLRGSAPSRAAPARLRAAGDGRGDRRPRGRPRTRRAHLAGRELTLTPKEFDLLALFASDPGAVLDAASASSTTCGTRTGSGPPRRSTCTSRRSARSSGSPAWIETVRGVGFRLVPPE